MTNPLTTRMRVNRVEYWRPDYADDGPLLTQLQLSHCSGDEVRLRIEHVGGGDGHGGVTRLVLNVSGKVDAIEPGDYLEVTFVKAPLAAPLKPHEVPF